MANRKPRKPKGGHYQEPEPPEPHKEEPDAVRVHEAYLEHRLSGGEPATPEAYQRAFEQFQSLPGAVRSTPPPPSPEEPAYKAEQRAEDDQKGESQ